jgi:hypothetical protein
MMVIYTRQARSLPLKNDDYYIRTYFYYTFKKLNSQYRLTGGDLR